MHNQEAKQIKEIAANKKSSEFLKFESRFSDFLDREANGDPEKRAHLEGEFHRMLHEVFGVECPCHEYIDA